MGKREDFSKRMKNADLMGTELRNLHNELIQQQDALDKRWVIWARDNAALQGELAELDEMYRELGEAGA